MEQIEKQVEDRWDDCLLIGDFNARTAKKEGPFKKGVRKKQENLKTRLLTLKEGHEFPDWRKEVE